LSAEADFLIMALTKKQKTEVIEDIKEKLSKQKAIVFVDYTGLGVKDLLDLRTNLREKESVFKVSKKTLLKIAFKDLSSSLSKKIDELEGQIGLVFGFGDIISPAKITYNFAKENDNLKILGGVFEGKFIEKEKVEELAQIPTREELLSRMVGSLSTPLSGLVNVLRGNIKGLLFTLSAINK